MSICPGEDQGSRYSLVRRMVSRRFKYDVGPGIFAYMCGAIAAAAMQTPQRAGDGEDDIEWIGGIGACGRTPGTEINSRAIGWGWNITPPQSRRCLPDADSLWTALAVGPEGSWPILPRSSSRELFTRGARSISSGSNIRDTRSLGAVRHHDSQKESLIRSNTRFLE